MASFTAGTTFVDGVANNVTAAKLGALVTNATPTSGLIQDRTAETVVATNDTFLIGDASDSNTLKRMTVANVMKAELTGTINTTAGTITTLNSTTGTITGLNSTTGTVATLNSTTGTITGLNSTTGTVATLNSTTGTITGLNSTTGTVATLNSTTGTITGLNSTTGTVATLNSTTGTITTGVIPTLTSITKITSGTGTAAAPAISPTGDTNTGIFFPAADTIAFSEGGTEGMRIDASGNVGIGETSPSFTQGGGLHIKNSDRANLKLQDSPSNVLTEISVADNSVSSNFIVDVDPTNIGSGGCPLIIRTGGGTERLRINSSGNVSIGTATALSKLHVHGDLTMSNATTAVTASTSTITPPATVAGYLTVSINGTSRKIAYYAT